MKGFNVAGNSDATLIAVGSLAFVGLVLFLKHQAKALANVNAGTPYDGTGVIGTFGNAANQVSGGALATAGAGLGGWVYDFLHPYDPNNNGPTAKQAISDNSASATAAASSTFTPSADFGTTGGW